MRHIFVVEDDSNIRELLVYALNNSGYRAIGFEGGDSLFKELENSIPDLLILDLMLNGESGYDILNRIRKSKDSQYIPVIILTAKNSEIDKVKGLDMGADDYITKPFSILEIVSRIKAILRRVPKNEENEDILSYQNISLNLKKREVYVDDEKIDLTYKEFELLYYFMSNKGIVLSRDKLMNEVWGFDYSGETRTVDVHIRTLRQKLESLGDSIKTVRNVGYKLGE